MQKKEFRVALIGMDLLIMESTIEYINSMLQGYGDDSYIYIGMDKKVHEIVVVCVESKRIKDLEAHYGYIMLHLGIQYERIKHS